MEPVYLEGNLPRGFCAECCSRMAKGELHKGAEVYPGVTLVSAYCAHHECGGTILIEPGRLQQRWQLVVPIDVVEWETYLATIIHARRGALEAIRNKNRDAN